LPSEGNEAETQSSSFNRQSPIENRQAGYPFDSGNHNI
jgi:hypothetical protein